MLQMFRASESFDRACVYPAGPVGGDEHVRGGEVPVKRPGPVQARDTAQHLGEAQLRSGRTLAKLRRKTLRERVIHS